MFLKSRFKISSSTEHLVFWGQRVIIGFMHLLHQSFTRQSCIARLMGGVLAGLVLLVQVVASGASTGTGDQEVYRGTTPRSLGYVTLPLKAVNGRTLKIELTEGARSRDGFNITELESQQNAATGAERAGGGTLGIVEFECYEPGSSIKVGMR